MDRLRTTSFFVYIDFIPLNLKSIQSLELLLDTNWTAERCHFAQIFNYSTFNF